MNKKCLRFTWVILFLLCGCATTANKYLKVHPETQATIKYSMEHNALCAGMTKDQVTAVRGKPSQTTQDEFDKKETWVYTHPNAPSDTVYCSFDKDKLVRIENPEERRVRQIDKYFKDHPKRSRFMDTIIEKKLLMEMNKTEVRLSRGKPKEINKSETPSSTFEQWIYDSTDSPNYLYFTDDKLISWHD